MDNDHESYQASIAKDEENKKLRQALIRIASGKGLNDFSADPFKWSSTVAYIALGGAYKDGKRITKIEGVQA